VLLVPSQSAFGCQHDMIKRHGQAAHVPGDCDSWGWSVPQQFGQQLTATTIKHTAVNTDTHTRARA
jgi:hypothetical protein